MPNKKTALLIGLGPLATEPDQKFIAAPSIRSWQFLQAALWNNHAVIVTKNLGPDQETGFNKIRDSRECIHYSTRENLHATGNFIRSLCKEHQFSSVTIIGSTSLAELLPYIPDNLPLWFDLNGSVLAEGQVKAAVEDNNQILDYYLNLEYQSLIKGDIFSAVSTPQKHTVIGELALIGRLNSYTTDYPFCHVIPDTYFPQPDHKKENVLRGKKIKDNAFIVLWSGGFNNWADEKTLFNGLEKAMRTDDSIYFAATGGRIEGVAHRVFDNFYQRVQSSQFKDRFFFEGWVDGSLIPSYYREADLAINIDLPSWETYLGARNRFLGWIYFDLPILTTALCEFAGDLASHRGCYTFEAGSAESLSKALINICQSPAREREATAKRARALFLEEYTVETIMQCYSRWLENPAKSPDNQYYRSHALKFSSYTPLSPDKMVIEGKENTRGIERYLKNIWKRIKKK